MRTGMQGQMRHDQRGFSLLELSLVVFIIGLLAALAAPSFKGVFTMSEEEMVKSHLARTIQLGIARASRQRTYKEVVFDLDDQRYWLQDKGGRDDSRGKKKKEVRKKLPEGFIFKGMYFPQGEALKRSGETSLEIRPNGTTEDFELDIARLNDEDEEVKYLRMHVTGSTGRATWLQSEDGTFTDM